MLNTIKIPFGKHTLVGDIMTQSTNIVRELLILHGGGPTSCRQSFQQTRKQFIEYGVSTVCFDFIGHGDTGGDLRSSSLKARTEQACCIIEKVRFTQSLSIMATSMGAYTAIKLLEHYDVSTLILVVPAIYNKNAYEIPFNGGFTQIIRQANSWKHSDAWKILSTYTGNILLVAAENDSVIPDGIIKNIYESVINAKKRLLYVAPGASHYVITDLRSKNPEQLDYLFELISNVL